MAAARKRAGQRNERFNLCACQEPNIETEYAPASRTRTEQLTSTPSSSHPHAPLPRLNLHLNPQPDQKPQNAQLEQHSWRAPNPRLQRARLPLVASPLSSNNTIALWKKL